MKIAVTGKGGVGKTTLSSILARLYADEGRMVLAADVDPDANLGLALGFSLEELEQIVPLSQQRELVQERTGAQAGTFAKFFKMNPRVDDIPGLFAKEKHGVKLLVLGTVKKGGGGCVCPEHVLLKQIISHLLLQNEDVVVLDMEAGLEHLGRGTTDCVDRFLVVVEPGSRSVQTYHSVKRLAEDLGISRVDVVANKVASLADEIFIRANVPADALLGIIHTDEAVRDADRQGQSPYGASERIMEEIKAIKRRIDADACV
ncbi:MAG: AAA family ATPase [Clostridia bacterium]